MSAAKSDIKAFQSLLNDLQQRFPKSLIDKLIVVSATDQRLYLIENSSIVSSFPISTAEAGLGNLTGSFKTPLGIHKISQKIGEGAELGTIFKARKNTQTIAKILQIPEEKSDADNITTRILWLTGMEKGVNLGGDMDTYTRYIYIHGTDEEGRLGLPVSHGCIRMSNRQVIELFDKVQAGTIVYIVK